MRMNDLSAVSCIRGYRQGKQKREDNSIIQRDIDAVEVIIKDEQLN